MEAEWLFQTEQQTKEFVWKLAEEQKRRLIDVLISSSNEEMQRIMDQLDQEAEVLKERAAKLNYWGSILKKVWYSSETVLMSFEDRRKLHYALKKKLDEIKEPLPPTYSPSGCN